MVGHRLGTQLYGQLGGLNPGRSNQINLKHLKMLRINEIALYGTILKFILVKLPGVVRALTKMMTGCLCATKVATVVV